MAHTPPSPSRNVAPSTSVSQPEQRDSLGMFCLFANPIIHEFHGTTTTPFRRLAACWYPERQSLNKYSHRTSV